MPFLNAYAVDLNFEVYVERITDLSSENSSILMEQRLTRVLRAKFFEPSPSTKTFLVAQKTVVGTTIFRFWVVVGGSACLYYRLSGTLLLIIINCGVIYLFMIWCRYIHVFKINILSLRYEYTFNTESKVCKKIIFKMRPIESKAGYSS